MVTIFVVLPWLLIALWGLLYLATYKLRTKDHEWQDNVEWLAKGAFGYAMICALIWVGLGLIYLSTWIADLF